MWGSLESSWNKPAHFSHHLTRYKEPIGQISPMRFKTNVTHCGLQPWDDELRDLTWRTLISQISAEQDDTLARLLLRAIELQTADVRKRSFLPSTVSPSSSTADFSIFSEHRFKHREFPRWYRLPNWGLGAWGGVVEDLSWNCSDYFVAARWRCCWGLKGEVRGFVT